MNANSLVVRRTVVVSLVTAFVLTALAVVVLGTMLVRAPAAGASDNVQSRGRYELANNVSTQIGTIKVRNAACLSTEDGAGALRMVSNPRGYDPEHNSITLKCGKH